MRKTYSIGRLFVTTMLQAQGAPFVDKGVTYCRRSLPAQVTGAAAPYAPPPAATLPKSFVGCGVSGHYAAAMLTEAVHIPREERVGDSKVIRLPFCKNRPSPALVIGLWRGPASSIIQVSNKLLQEQGGISAPLESGKSK